MVDNSFLPVAVGLGIGTVFVVMFAVLAQPSSFSPTSTDKIDGMIIAHANRMEAAHVFFSQYPEGTVKVDRTENETEGSVVRYGFQKVYDDGEVNEVRMFVIIDDKTDKPTNKIFVDCAVWYVNGFGGMTYNGGGGSIANELRSTECAK